MKCRPVARPADPHRHATTQLIHKQQIDDDAQEQRFTLDRWTGLLWTRSLAFPTSPAPLHKQSELNNAVIYWLSPLTTHLLCDIHHLLSLRRNLAKMAMDAKKLFLTAVFFRNSNRWFPQSHSSGVHITGRQAWRLHQQLQHEKWMLLQWDKEIHLAMTIILNWTVCLLLKCIKLYNLVQI